MKSLGIFLKTVSTIFVFSILTACGGGGATQTTPVLKVMATSPDVNAIGVLTNTVLSITFDKDLDPTTFTNVTFSLVGSRPVTGIINYDAITRTVTFTPDSELEPGTVHTATLTKGVTDTAGNELESVYELNFTTEIVIRRVSINSNKGESDNESHPAKISADGRYVVFRSNATNLVDGDTNADKDIFRHDTQTGTTIRISVASDGQQGNGSSLGADISADGRYVVFESTASNLVDDDTNDGFDIFKHDTETGMTTRVSVDSNGDQADKIPTFLGLSIPSSREPIITPDGRYVVFSSSANDLVSRYTNGQLRDIFRHDTQTGSTILVSVNSAEQQTDKDSNGPDISDDGRYVVFSSMATNLVNGDTNAATATTDIFRHDILTGVTTRVSVDSTGQQGNGSSFFSQISEDGRYVFFASSATNLVSGDTNAAADVFKHDTQTGSTTRVSVDTTGQQGDGDSYSPAISANGRYVMFTSNATNLVSDDTNATVDVFKHDEQTGRTTCVSLNSAGQQANSHSEAPSISFDSRYVVFSSFATNLVPEGDTNLSYDIFRVLLTK